jgi:hypothetical protein
MTMKLRLYYCFSDSGYNEIKTVSLLQSSDSEAETVSLCCRAVKIKLRLCQCVAGSGDNEIKTISLCCRAVTMKLRLCHCIAER